MQTKMKPLFSLLAIGIFVVIASATFYLPDESTNVEIKISDCKEKPVVHGKVHIEIHSSPGHYGMIFLTQQKVRHDTTCTYDVITNYRQNFNCDDQGKYIYEEDVIWTHDNSEDLWRIEVGVRDGTFGGVDAFNRRTQVKKYSDSNFYFDFKPLPPL